MKALIRPGGGESTPSEGDQVAHIHDSIFVVCTSFFFFVWWGDGFSFVLTVCFGVV